jgi:dihydrofolate reductase
MGKLIYDVSMSLDGFITGANPRAEEGWGGLGEGGERLHDWGFKENVDPRSLEIMERYSTFGANIFGRTGYDLSIPNWGANGPSGEARVPTVIVSHTIPDTIPAGGVYHFVNGIDAAFETAKTLAGDKDIYLTGSNVAEQFLTRGLIDELSIHLVPVLFGSGTHLFGDLAGAVRSANSHIALEPIETIQTADAIHLRFRVVK